MMDRKRRISRRGRMGEEVRSSFRKGRLSSGKEGRLSLGRETEEAETVDILMRGMLMLGMLGMLM